MDTWLQALHASSLLFSFAVDEAHCVTSWGAQQSTCMCTYCVQQRVLVLTGIVHTELLLLCSLMSCGATHLCTGHDFRPAYLHLAKLRTIFPGVPFAALVS